MRFVFDSRAAAAGWNQKTQFFLAPKRAPAGKGIPALDRTDLAALRRPKVAAAPQSVFRPGPGKALLLMASFWGTGVSVEWR